MSRRVGNTGKSPVEATRRSQNKLASPSVGDIHFKMASTPAARFIRYQAAKQFIPQNHSATKAQ